MGYPSLYPLLMNMDRYLLYETTYLNFLKKAPAKQYGPTCPAIICGAIVTLYIWLYGHSVKIQYIETAAYHL